MSKCPFCGAQKNNPLGQCVNCHRFPQTNFSSTELKPGDKLYNVWNGELDVLIFHEQSLAHPTATIDTYLLSRPGDNIKFRSNMDPYKRTELEAWQEYLKDVEKSLPEIKKELEEVKKILEFAEKELARIKTIVAFLQK